MSDRERKVADLLDEVGATDELAGLAEVATALHLGRPALDVRLSELSAGFPGRGGGGRGGSELTPTEAGADSLMAGTNDAAERELTAWSRDLHKALEAAADLWVRYKKLVEPRDGVSKLTDPGCELCANVPGHWCPIFGVRVVVTEPKAKNARRQVQAFRLCQWCFTFTWPSRAGRLPSADEVKAHSEGRRVRWHGGLEPQLVEVACPDCRDESRQARRACTTCGHSGKVLKQSA